jgi:hypothetical protein
MAESMKMTVFSGVAPCSLVEVTSISEVLAAFIIRASVIALMVEAASVSEMSVNLYQTTWCNIPEDSHHLIFNQLFNYVTKYLYYGVAHMLSEISFVILMPYFSTMKVTHLHWLYLNFLIWSFT